MKTSKKILSIALVLMMALNVFAFSANAVLDPNHFMNEPGKYHTVDHSLARGDEEAWVGIELAAEHPSTTNLNDIKAGDIVRLTMKSRVNFYAQTLKVFFYYDFFAFTPCLKNGTIPSAAMNGRVAYESFRDKNYYFPLSANETGAGLKFDTLFLCGWVETLEKRVSDWRPIYFTDEMAAIYNYVTVLTISNADYSFMGYTTLNDDSGELETMDYIFASVSFKAREDIQPGSYKFFTWDQYPAEAAIIDYNKNGNYDVRDGGRIGGYAKINLMPGMEEITVTVQGAAEPVDFSALNTLIDEFDGRTDSATYTTASWATYAAAVDAGRLVAADADATQDAVDAAALAINNAKAALVEIIYANYTALDEALALVPAYAPEFYTAETIGAFNAAMAAGASVDRNLTDADQATVDAAAKAITDAYAALKLIENSSIVDITPTAGGEYAGPIGQTGDVNFTVNNATQTASRLVLINKETNATQTYDRAHSRVSIVDNGNGTETWTITLALAKAEASFDVKVKFGSKWEDATVNFTLKAETPEVTPPVDEVYSFAVAEYQTVRGEDSVFTAKVLSDVNSLQLVRGDGATMTFAKNTAGVTVVDNGDGTATWTISKALSFYGEAQYTLRYKIVSTWSESKFKADVIIVKG